MTAAEGAMASSFISHPDEEPELESINFHESLRFFQDQLHIDGKRSPTIHMSRSDHHCNELPASETKGESFSCELDVKSPRNCRISIPTVETILESVKVLRAIQKSQEQRWPLSKILSNADQPTKYTAHLDNSSKINGIDYGDLYSNAIEEQLCNHEFVSDFPQSNGSQLVNCMETREFWPGNIANPKRATEFNQYENIFNAKKCDLEMKCYPEFENVKDHECDSEIEKNQCSKGTTSCSSGPKTMESFNNNETSHFWPNNSIDEKYGKNTDAAFSNGVSLSALKISNNKEAKICGGFNDSSDSDEIATGGDNKDTQLHFQLNSENFLENPSDLNSIDLLKTVVSKCTDSEIAPLENREVMAILPDLDIENDSTAGNIVEQKHNSLLVHAHNSSVEHNVSGRNESVQDTMTPCASIDSTLPTTDQKKVSNNGLTQDSVRASLSDSVTTLQNNQPEAISSITMKSPTGGNLCYKTVECEESLETKSDGEIRDVELDEEFHSVKSDLGSLESESDEDAQCDKETGGTIFDKHYAELREMAFVNVSNEQPDLNVETVDKTKFDEHSETIGNELLQPKRVEIVEENEVGPPQTNVEENYNQYEVLTEMCEFVPNGAKKWNEPSLVLNWESSSNTSYLRDETSYPFSNGHANSSSSELNSVSSDTDDLKKKFITSSWDLVSIVKLLYVIPEIKPQQECAGGYQSKVFLLSRGSFSQYQEGIYDVLLKDNNLHVLQNTKSILSFVLSYADVNSEGGNVLKIDNKMGRTLSVRCDSTEQTQQLEEILLQKCRQTECISLVHYPLKCHRNVIIIDLGSCSTRAGILMDQPTLPSLFFPSVCATDKTTGKCEYGMEALQPSKRQNSAISFPIRPSEQIIKHNIDVDKVTGIFKKVFNELRVDPTHYSVQVCLPRSLSISTQNALVDVLLDKLTVKAVSLAHQAIFTMYAHNVSTGVVVDVGDRMDILPVIDGFIVESGVTRLPYGGQRLIHHMKHALAEKHLSLSNDIDSFVVQFISESLSYVAQDYEEEKGLAASYPDVIRKTVDLRHFAKDENCIRCATLDDARFKVPEGLFNPDMWGLDFPGIHKLVQKAIQAASVDARKKIAENIYVSGGVTLIPGFVERLRKEVTKLNEPRITPKVFASDYRFHSTFIGACRFARMDVFPQVCVTREEYLRNKQSSLKKFALCI